jgi:anti-sigma regulatory factor (Ser/Thr protein kinase)
MHKSFSREIASLDNIFDFMNEFFAAHMIDESFLSPVHLAVEELFTNMVKYNRGTNEAITITAELEPRCIRVTLTDPSGEPFDGNKASEVDVKKSLEERKVGGLGVYLVKRMMDSLDYSYADGKNTVTFTLQLE